MKRALALAAMILAGLNFAQAEEAAKAGAAQAKADPAKGQEIVTKVCAACHGPDGNSVVGTYPKLAGQFPEYIQKQLNNFKAGANGKAERPNPVMAGYAAPLSADDIRAVRPGLGLAPKFTDQVLGRRAKIAIARGTPLSWDLLA